jgi:type IV pilus assembly protein PilB
MIAERDSLRSSKEKLGEILVRAHLLSTEQLLSALGQQNQTGKKLGELFVELGNLTAEELDYFLNLQNNPPPEELNLKVVNINAIEKLGAQFCVARKVIPILEAVPVGNRIFQPIAMVQRNDIATWELVAKKLQCHPIPFYYNSEQIINILQHLHRQEETRPIFVEESIDYQSFIQKLFLSAIKRNASDIHIECSDIEISIRFRIDGILYKVKQFSKKHQIPLIETIKKLSHMDSSINQLPQSGKLILKVEGNRYQMNIITFPSINGESVSIKIININEFLKDLSQIGLSKEQYTELKLALDNQGMIIVSGPLMNGTITTEYAIVKYLAESNRKIFTLEAPIQQKLDNVHQAEINPSAGFDYLTGLNSLSLSDPDCIYISDIPNLEVAIQALKIASRALIVADFNASSCGHVITALREMGVPNVLLASSISYIINQRLVRKICDNCKEITPISANILMHMGFTKKEAENLKVYQGKGCSACNQLGYNGRIALFETLRFVPSIKSMIAQDEPVERILAHATNYGYKSLHDACIEKIQLGLTTIEEFQRIKL